MTVREKPQTKAPQNSQGPLSRVRMRWGLPLVLLLSTALGAGSPDAQGAISVAGLQAQDAAAFWTPARMARARPLDGRRVGRPTVLTSGATEIAKGRPHEYPPFSPDPEASTSASFEVVPDSTSTTDRVNGVVFIVTPFGLGRCSGTSVNAPNFSVVFTAGHCVNSGGPHGRWLASRWVFVPGYRYGQRPFGVFPAKWVDVTNQWRRFGGENFDVGAAVVGRNEKRQRLAKAVGGAGIAWGLKARQVFDVHGYPAEAPFDGETQRLCSQTPFLGHDARSFMEPGPLNLAVDCNVTGGASGGGWTIRDGILNSVTDYGYGDDPNTVFGPYFGREVGRLFRRAERVR